MSEFYDDQMPYDEWARAKYNEVKQFINPCNAQAELDPVRLNEVLTQYGNHFAWAITIQEIESNRLNVMQTEYDSWYRLQYSKAERILREERGGGPRAASIESTHVKVELLTKGENERKKKAIVDQRARVELLKGFVRVLDRQGSILQTLSSNMRSELFFAGGVSVMNSETMTEESKVRKAAILVKKAMKGQRLPMEKD